SAIVLGVRSCRAGVAFSVAAWVVAGSWAVAVFAAAGSFAVVAFFAVDFLAVVAFFAVDFLAVVAFFAAGFVVDGVFVAADVEAVVFFVVGVAGVLAAISVAPWRIVGLRGGASGGTVRRSANSCKRTRAPGQRCVRSPRDRTALRATDLSPAAPAG